MIELEHPFVTELEVDGKFDPGRIEKETDAAIIGHETLNIRNIPGNNAVKKVLLCHSRSSYFCPGCSSNPINNGDCSRAINEVKVST